MNPQTIHALIVDDEPLARKRVRSLLRRFDEIEKSQLHEFLERTSGQGA